MTKTELEQSLSGLNGFMRYTPTALASLFIAVASAGALRAAAPAHGHDAPASPPAHAAPAERAGGEHASAEHPLAEHAPPAAASPAPGDAAKAAVEPATVSASVALKMLADGNERYVAVTAKHPNQDQARLCETYTNGQHPYAAILTCADSRVPPELIFDAGIGDLFVTRVVGNVASVDEVATLEYAVENYGVNLIVVMGHLKCGAVAAVVDNARLTPNLDKLLGNIAPAADSARKTFPQLSGPRLVEKATRMNVRQSIGDLSARSDLLRERIASGKLVVVGSIYNLHTGEVDWLEPGENVAAGRPVAELEPAREPAAKSPAPASARPSKPAKTDPHAAPAAGHDAHDAHGAAATSGAPAHAEKESADPHSAGHGAPSTQPGEHAAGESPEGAAKPKKENFLALGGLLGASSVVSFTIIKFMKSRA